jgi:acyl-CoA-binding protein
MARSYRHDAWAALKGLPGKQPNTHHQYVELIETLKAGAG